MNITSNKCPSEVMMSLPCVLEAGHTGLHRTVDPGTVNGVAEKTGYEVIQNVYPDFCLQCERDEILGIGEEKAKLCKIRFSDVLGKRMSCTRPEGHTDRHARI